MSGWRHPERVRLTEVGPRDGLQNERRVVPTAAKIEFVDRLSAAGFPEIEVTSFVSPRWVPQLADAAEVMAGITRRPGILYSALVPNEQGLERALAARVDKVAVFTAASEGFARRNLNASVAESLARIQPVVRGAVASGLPVRGYVSCVVRCPFDGPTAPEAVRRVVEALLALGVQDVDLGDTIGVAVPDDVDRLLEGLASCLRPEDVTMHLHDTRRTALACAYRSLQLGVRSFDASAGGLGGCPFAPGASGNLATEHLCYLLSGCGIQTGVDASAAAAAARDVQAATVDANS